MKKRTLLILLMFLLVCNSCNTLKTGVELNTTIKNPVKIQKLYEVFGIADGTYDVELKYDIDYPVDSSIVAVSICSWLDSVFL